MKRTFSIIAIVLAFLSTSTLASDSACDPSDSRTPFITDFYPWKVKMQLTLGRGGRFSTYLPCLEVLAETACSAMGRQFGGRVGGYIQSEGIDIHTTHTYTELWACRP